MRSHQLVPGLVSTALVVVCLGSSCPCQPPPVGCPVPSAGVEGLAIVSTAPCDGATNISVNGPLGITFNRSVDPATLGADLLPVSVDATLQWSDDNRTVRVVLNAPLNPDTSYGLVILQAIDTAGNMLTNPTTICFSTGATLDCPKPPDCQPFNVTDDSVLAYTDFDYQKPFATDSAWNTPIGTNPQIVSNSNVMVQRFAEVHDQFAGMWLGVIQDVVPIYFADASTPRHEVRLVDPSASTSSLQDVPIPDHAIPDCGLDFFMAVWDRDANRFYDFWRARKASDGSWTAATANWIASTGTGVFPQSQGIRASGFALAAGMIWPHELAAGKIEHALLFSYPLVQTGSFVAPATSTDGPSEDPAAIPMGSRLQLDPGVDLSSLGLESWERTIAEALQKYGMFLGDTGGGIGISLVHVYSFKGNPYQGLLPDTVEAEQGVLLSKLPADRFRVVK